jgi:sterol desaturase/sphingolipid hydroxylase (fatty acid hydroxylase superfamily)
MPRASGRFSHLLRQHVRNLEIREGITMEYNWIAALVFFAVVVALSLATKFLVFKVPAFERMREENRVVDKAKLARDRFRAAVMRNNKAGMYFNIAFYLTILPFCVSLEPRPFWRHALDAFVVLAVFDLFYYLTHRFLFHGPILRKVHSLHHQARTPTHVDALFVHPIETCIGLLLFLGTIPLIAAISGAPLSAYSMAFATLVFTQLNTLNHAYTHLPGTRFGFVDYITGVHAAHHVDMSHGNYSTLTMVYDKIFGTYEPPVNRTAA